MDENLKKEILEEPTTEPTVKTVGKLDHTKKSGKRIAIVGYPGVEAKMAMRALAEADMDKIEIQEPHNEDIKYEVSKRVDEFKPNRAQRRAKNGRVHGDNKPQTFSKNKGNFYGGVK